MESTIKGVTRIFSAAMSFSATFSDPTSFLKVFEIVVQHFEKESGEPRQDKAPKLCSLHQG